LKHNFISILNKEGFLFEKYCAQKIKEAGWIIDFEQYPISENESFDIKANLVTYETALNIAVVECKRQDPTRKYWVFYRKDARGPISEHCLIQTHSLFTQRSRFFWKGKVMRAVLEGLNESKLGHPSCHTTGMEVFKHGKSWKVNSEVIYKASVKVAKGVHHLFDSEAERLHNNLRVGLKHLEKDKKEHGWPYFLGGTLIPVVITSAPLFSIVFDANEMDTKTFNVSREKLMYEEEEWLVYEFPLPSELRYDLKEIFTLTGENRYAKMHIFIVNGKSITHFFKCLSESIETRSEKSYRMLQSEFMEFYDPKKVKR
jgi:hypothetical protein